MADLDPDSLQKLRVVDLKEHLSARGLPTNGLKADLVKRLHDALISTDNDDEGAEQSSPDQEDEPMAVEEGEDQMSTGEEERIAEELALQARLAAEQEEMRLEEERLKIEQEARQAQIMREEAERHLAEIEEQRQRQIEEEKLRLAKEQQKMLEEEEKLRKAEEQQRMLAEEEKKKQLAEQQQRLLAEEQQRILAEEQKQLIVEEERQKEKELFQLQQQALLEKDEEQRKQSVLPMPPPPPPSIPFPPGIHIPPMPSIHMPPMPSAPQIPPPMLAVSQQISVSSMGSMHTVTVPPSSHIQMQPPPAPPTLSSMGSLPPPPPAMMITSMQSRPMAPPPAPASATGMGHPITMSISSLPARPVHDFTKPPPPPPPPSLPSTTASTLTQSQNEPNDKIEMVNTTIGSDVPVPGTENKEEAIKLPQAVEKVFALKTERAQQLGVDPDSVITPSVEKEPQSMSKNIPLTLVSVDEMEDAEDAEEETKKSKESRNRRRKKKKKQKMNSRLRKAREQKTEIKTEQKPSIADIDIEYVQEVLDISDPMYSQFIGIFEKFKLNEPEKENISLDTSKDAQTDSSGKQSAKKKPDDDDDDDDDDDEDEDEKKENEDKPKLSKRKMKKLSRMSVAELKQKVGRPELVEMHDVTAKDPVLLLHLKASRNTVPVPRHWCFKRKYLQGKRGIEKPAFELPDFIKRTGIMEMRQALQEKEDQKTMKAKMRERVRPKLGKIDIDYQKLHDAFFKWQTKPKMTIHGDLYYEGKEFETRLKEKKPGDLSDDLRVALGMPTGPNANKCPPPWLIAMQRYGPPPSYPNLKIPGLNAPIPDTCSFGYHAGGWGKPPVDEMGRPLYGDVFGTQSADNMPQIPEEEIDHTLWGELESESSEEEEYEDDEDEDEEEAKPEDETGLVTPAEGLITPSGFSSIPAGMETPDMIELRKRKTEAEMEGGETPALYTILPEKKSDRVGAAMMGSTHIYDLAAAIPASKVKAAGTTSVPPQGIEVALDPSELEMDTAAMAARYEQTMREQQSQLEKEDLSDMVAEHAARQKTKRKKQQQDSGKAPKKYKEFKF